MYTVKITKKTIKLTKGLLETCEYDWISGKSHIAFHSITWAELCALK